MCLETPQLSVYNKLMNYLLELGTEEIPARFVQGLLTNLKQNLVKQLSDNRITYDSLTAYGTYRRLALIVTELSETQPDIRLELKGPPQTIATLADGSYTPAGHGFLKKNAVTEGVLKDGYLYANVFQKGQKTSAILADMILKSIRGCYLPVAMHWGNEPETFIRPVQWIVSLLNNDILPLTFAGKTAGNITYGHRFLSAGPTLLGKTAEINTPEDYLKVLEQLNVMVDQTARKKSIKDSITTLYPEAEIDEDLLDEVTWLVEKPTTLAGTFPAEFLEVPDTILTTTMKKHQKYFAVRKNGKLHNTFIITADNVSETNSATIIAGNEKVLKARLHDARFYYTEDTHKNFDFFNNKLKTITFQQGLGSIADKNERHQKILTYLAETIELDQETLKKASEICALQKADLATSMVFEFTELQGYVGQQYALKWGYPEDIALGIKEHYLPTGAGDSLPSTLPGSLCSIADKLDSICGHFALGHIPSGSQDPYALRRQANGIVLICLAEDKLHVDLEKLLEFGINNLKIDIKIEYRQQLIQFFKQRLDTILRDKGLLPETVEAIITLDLALLRKRKAFLPSLLDSPNFKAITEAAVRVANLAKNHTGEIEVQKDLFEKPIEAALLSKMEQVELEIKQPWANLLTGIADLSQTIEHYFIDIMVMVENTEVKHNRLSLLSRCHKVYAIIADFKALN